MTTSQTTNAGYRMRASATDRTMAFLGQRAHVSFHVVAEYEGAIDRDRLQVAWEWLGVRHPILSSRLERDVWLPGPPIPPVDVVEPHGDWREVEDALLARAVDADRGSVARLGLAASRGAGRMVLTLHHAAVDGRAAAMLLDDLRTMYVRERPLPVDDTPRTAAALLAEAGIPWPARQRIVARWRRRWRTAPPSEHTDPAASRTAGGPETLSRATFEIGPVLDVLAARRRRNGWHIDAVLVGLFAAAWARVFSDRGVGGWLVAADFRRDLGVSRGAGNLSGVEPVAVPDVSGDLEATIEAANAGVAALQSSRPGLAPEIMAAMIPHAPTGAVDWAAGRAFDRAGRLRYTRSVSNLGVWPEAVRDWDTASVTSAVVVPPALTASYATFEVSTLGDSTTATTLTSPHRLTPGQVGRIEMALYDLAEIGGRSP